MVVVVCVAKSQVSQEEDVTSNVIHIVVIRVILFSNTEIDFSAGTKLNTKIEHPTQQ